MSKRSYREEWIGWGITAALQVLLMEQKKSYSVTDIYEVAMVFGVTDQLVHRLSYVPQGDEQGALQPDGTLN